MNPIALEFGTDVCQALPFQYAFSGCDTTSSFYSIGKCNWFDYWIKCEEKEELTETFLDLSNKPEEVTEQQIDVLEHYVKKLYYPSKKSFEGINLERMNRFHSLPTHDLRLIPVSRLGLIEHCKRVCFQAGWSWVECRENVVLPNAEAWGRVRTSYQKLIPRWQTLEECNDHQRVENVIFVCTCVRSMCKNCKCTRRKVQCLPFCKYQRKCMQ